MEAEPQREPRRSRRPQLNLNIELLREPRNLAIAAFLGGLVVGLVVLGWWLFPVSWEDASAAQLRPDIRADYLRAAIDAYTLRPDDNLASQRLDALGDAVDETMAAVASAPGLQSVEVIARFQALMGGGTSPIVQPTSGSQIIIPTNTPETDSGGSLFDLGTLFTTFCGITLILGLALGVLYIVRSRQEGGSAPLPAPWKGREAAQPAEPDLGADAPPLSQWMTTYVMGDDLFDDSFSIDSPAGEFMGECGVGIAETIGVGSPKRVSAFEIWLFDKNDIQTVTKVMMSTHVFRDDGMRNRLSAKGEPILASPGVEAVLETATLQMVARVVDMQYGQGPLPEDSFFERATLELAVWSKV
jgi:hypothetical protein